MSNILKGIINEVSPHNYDSDWDYQDAVARSGKSRSSYRSQEDDTFDSDVAYSRKMYQLGQQQKTAKEKAQRDSDHDRLASGTNEDITEASNPYEPVMIQGYDKWLKLVSIPNVDRHAYKSDITAVTSLGDVIGEFNTDKDLGYVIKKYAKGVSESLDDPWGDQGNFAGDKPVNLGGVSIKNIQVGDTVKYFGQPSKVVAMSKDRKYSRITISKGMGTVTQDVLTRDLQQLGQGKAIEENDNIQTRMRMDDYYKLADAIQEKLRQAIKLGDNELVHKLSKERADLDARVKKYGLIPESQLDEISNEKLAQYKTAAALDAGKADKEGDYKRGDKRFSGIVKATKKQFANDTKKSGISQGINEFAPIKPPTAGAFGGNKDYGQPNSSRYIGGNKFVVGTTNNYVLTATIDKWGLEWDEDDEIWFLDSPGAAHIADASEGEIELPPPREQRNQIHDLVTDYLNERNSADLQKVAAYYGHSNDGEMATNESSEAPRFNSKQEVINHFVKNGKSAAAGAAAWERGYRGSSKKPIELKKPPQRSYHDELDDKRYSNTFENLGDQLKSNSLNALVQAKLAIEQQRQAEIEAWKRDFEKNTVQKAQQGLRREFEPTPVAQPGEKHSVLKARLAQLNNAIQKQELVDKLVDRLERKGLLTPAMQNDTDTRMHVRYGAKDNYESLNKKLDNAIQTLQNRLNVRKISGLKEVHDERDEYDNPRQGRDYGKGNLFVDPGSNEFKKEVHIGSNDGERGRPKNLKGVSKSLPADAFGRTTGKIPDSARPTSKEDPFKDIDEDLDENLHKWFQEKWVRFGPDGKIRGDCARGDDSEGKPKCLPQSKAHSLGKKGRASAASRKRREDPNPERSGKAINVNTKKKTDEDLNRRGFLKGMGAAAVAGAGINAVKNSSPTKKLYTVFGDGRYIAQVEATSEKEAEQQIESNPKYKTTQYRVVSAHVADPYGAGGTQQWSAPKQTKSIRNVSIGNTESDVYSKAGTPNKKSVTGSSNREAWWYNDGVIWMEPGGSGSQLKVWDINYTKNESVAQGVAEGSDQITEYRNRLLQYVKSLLPTWPEYVLKDWLVPNKGDFSNLPDTELKNGIMEKLKGAGLTPNSKWQLVPDMKFTMDMFDPMTKQRLIGRAGGSSDLGMGIPRDKERHATQAALAQQQGGVRKEPVLLIKTNKGYELLEGWHRTIQHFAKYPDGYTGPAYVAVAQGQQGVAEEQLDELSCWSGYHRVAGTKAGFPGSCAKNKTNEQGVAEAQHSENCPHCGGEMVSEELMNEKKDACYYKVKSRYKVWPSAYASGALVKCRKKGADSWGNGGKSNESVAEATGTTMDASQALQKLKQIAEMRSKFTYYGLQEAGHADIVLNAIKACSAFIDHFRNNKQLDYVQTLKKLQTEIIAFKNADAFTTLGQLLQGTLGKINFQQGVAEEQLDEKWTKKYKDSINCSNPKGFSQKAHCAGKQKNESAIMKGLKL